METNKKILITGGLGFIGLHLARKLLSRMDTVVTVVDNFSNSKIDDEVTKLQDKYPDTFRVIQGDLYRGDVAPIDVDEVYHLAAVRSTKYRFHGAETLEKNFITVMNLINQFRNKKNVKILFASSGETSGGISKRDMPTAESTTVGVDDITDKRWTYAMSKIAGEMLFLHGDLDCKFVIARMQNPYGPRMGWDNVVPIFIKKLVEGERVIDTSSPDDTRPYTYIDDVVEGLITLMENSETDGKIYNVCSPKSYTVTELVEALAKIVKEDTGEDVVIQSTDRSATVERREMSVEMLSSLGWKEDVELGEGLKITYQWYKNYINEHKNEN